MPRKRKAARAFARSRLSQTQREQLLYGYSFGSNEPAFENEAAERTAWERYGEQIKAERWGAGERPYAFFRWTLRINPVPMDWPNQLRILLDRQLVSVEEKFAIEARYLILDPEQSADFNRSFEVEAGLFLGIWGADTLKHLFDEFAFAAEWHTERGRSALAHKYRRCSENTWAAIGKER